MNQEKSPKKSQAKQKTSRKRSGAKQDKSQPNIVIMDSIIMGTGGGRRSQRNTVEDAQDIMYQAWEAPTLKKAIALAKKALTVSPDCADAYNLLADYTAKSLEEAYNLYRQGVEAGERALGEKTFVEDVGYFWGILETRPYMRARAGLAKCLWKLGQREAAVEHYWDMLRLNPGDNQGIRDSLMLCLIILGRDKDAEKLFKQFKDDGMAMWLYSRTLLDFRKHGDNPKSDKSLKAALEENLHVPDYLLGRKKLPQNLPGYYGWGDDNEAVLYVHENLAAWKTTPESLEWLASKV